MKKFGLLVLLALAVVAVKEGRNRFGGSDDDPTSRRFLKGVADNANRQLPRMVDAETEMLRVDAGDGYLVYRYRLVNQERSLLELYQVDMLKAAIKTQTCASQTTRQNFLNRGVSIRFTYVDRNDDAVLTFIVRPTDCRA